MKHRRLRLALATLLLAAGAAFAVGWVLSYAKPATWTVSLPDREALRFDVEGSRRTAERIARSEEDRVKRADFAAHFVESRQGRLVWLTQRAIDVPEGSFVMIATPRRVGAGDSEWLLFNGPTAAPRDPVARPANWRERLGFAVMQDGPRPLRTQPRSADFSAWQVMLPHWVLVLLFTVPGMWLLWRGRRQVRWAAEGRCVQCGYDLRATPDRCPECGKAPRPVEATGSA